MQYRDAGLFLEAFNFKPLKFKELCDKQKKGEMLYV